MVGAELFCLSQFFIGAGSSDHSGVEKLGHLNGGAPDAASCPKDENILAGLQLGSDEKHVPGGLEDKWNRGGFFKGQLFRIRHAIYFWSAQELGAAAVDEVTKIGEVAAAVILAGDAGRAFAAGHAWSEDHFLANAHGSDIRSDLGDFTGNVTAGNVW